MELKPRIQEFNNSAEKINRVPKDHVLNEKDRLVKVDRNTKVDACFYSLDFVFVNLCKISNQKKHTLKVPAPFSLRDWLSNPTNEKALQEGGKLNLFKSIFACIF